MEDQILKLKASLYDKDLELEQAKADSKNISGALDLLLKALQDKLEITDEQLQRYGTIEAFVKDLEKYVLVKEEVESVEEEILPTA